MFSSLGENVALYRRGGLKAGRPTSGEAAQVAELKAIEANAPMPIEGLLTRLRGLAREARPTAQLPLNTMAFLAHCSVVVQCEPSAEKKGPKDKKAGGGKKGADEKASKEAVGRFFVAFGSSKCVPPAPPPKPAARTSNATPSAPARARPARAVSRRSG